MTPSEFEERATAMDLVEILAHFGLKDPERKLEFDIYYKDAYDEIMQERKNRAAS
jgi:hypothetical protein